MRSSLTGEIPSSIFNNMSSLKHINLAHNHLSGSLPVGVTRNNLPNLEELYLHSNQLTGQIPSAQLDCDKLRLLYLANNQFTGSIPFSVFNILTLIALVVSYNGFTGQLPPTIGSSLPNLELLYLTNNRLSGSIPSSISNASKLSVLDLSTNSFKGHVPDFSNLRLLQRLLIPENNLTGESPNQELRFVSSLQNCRYLEMVEMSLNQFNGILPRSVGNLSTSLQIFRAFGSHIKGAIPAEFGNLTSLRSIELDSNELTRPIPKELAKLKQAAAIYLEDNRLQGQIPSDLCEMNMLGDLYLSGNMIIGQRKSLKWVFLDSNRLTSSVPRLWNLADLWGLNLSDNLLTGQISPKMKNLKALINLNLSHNQFTGEIPSSIGSLESWVTLTFAHNDLQGSIPLSLGDLRGLESLDLSNNNLSGSIPRSLEKLSYIRYFDVSLKGEIPSGESFANFSAQSFVQNYALCGPARFSVPPCKKSGSKHVPIVVYMMVPIVSAAILALVISLWLIMIRRRNRTKNDFVLRFRLSKLGEIKNF